MKNLSQQFGSRKILKSQKTDLVQDVFTDVSNNYNLMNDIISFGAHRLWKKRLIEMINIQNNQKIIDVGSGTGDIGLKISRLNKTVDIYLCDLNLKMMEVNRDKKYNKKTNLNWIGVNAEELPFKDDYFDKYIISFCLRNVTDIKKTLKESFRVLKQGGQFFCLEFSRVDLPILNIIYNSYKNNIIPLLGKYISRKKNAYKYLAESIDIFPNQKLVVKELERAGYEKISYYNLFGGIVSIHKGWKT